MKRLFVIAFMAISLFTVISGQAQVKVNVNISTQPVWGPTGYDHVDYYYLPDIGAYYSISRRQYIFREGNGWLFSQSLPPQYKNIDLYKSYKVVINEKKPWLRDDDYRKKYEPYKGRHDQEIIRDSHDSRYFVNKEHPEHNKWAKEHKHRN